MNPFIKFSTFLGLAVALLLFTFSSFAQMQFVQNKGQWDRSVLYRADFPTGAFFLENKGFTVLLNKEEDVVRLSEMTHGHGPKNTNPTEASFSQIKLPIVPLDTITLRSFAYNVSFLGASPNAEKIADRELLAHNNYYIGNNPANWASDCKVFEAVTYKNIYPNIDIRYYNAADQLKYDFIVHPGGNPEAIALRYDGGVKLSIKNKELVIGTSVGDVKELVPYSYQASTALKGSQVIDVKYELKDNVVSFDVANYDPKTTLVIDPQIVFCSLTGSSSDNWGYTATPGPDGSFYSGGISFGQGFPTSMGAFQTVFQGGQQEDKLGPIDIAIFKFSANGSQRLYATYLGGSGNEQPHSMIVDAAGNLVVAGRTSSANYPTKGGISRSGTFSDIIVTKFNSTGTALIGSVKIGGTGDDGVNFRSKSAVDGAINLRRNYGDDARSEVILDAANNIILASCTQSKDFPTLNPFQPVFGGGTGATAQDGVVLKFNPDLTSLLVSSFYGGSGEDACFVAAIDPLTQNLYIGGGTSSTNILGDKSNVISGTLQGEIDGFVLQLNPSATAIIKTTYIGTSGIDIVYGLKFDRLGFPYVMGTTTGNWVPVNATYSNPGSKQFIAKLQPNLSSYIYSTNFGKQDNLPTISPIAFLVDRCENVYVSGWGGGININYTSAGSNTFGLPQKDPLQGIPAPDGKDFYFFVLKKDASDQLFGSHFGQNGGEGDHVDGGTSRFDANGIIYQAICANCGGRSSTERVDYPTTPGVWARRNGGNGCNLAALKIDMDFAGVGSDIQSSIDGVVNDSTGCLPVTVNFTDLERRGQTYYWNFNSSAFPNNTDTITKEPKANFTFNTAGTFRVRLIAEDLNTCNLRDTSYVNITVGIDRATPNFTKRKLPPCTSSNYEFVNTTTSSLGTAFTNRSFVWDFGDGSPIDSTLGKSTVIHNFPGPGTYFVKLTVIDPRFCNAPETKIDTLRINSLVDARPESPALGCAPYTAMFKNNSLGGLQWLWDFGDPASGANNSSTLSEPTHLYQNIGTYRYRLIAYDSTTCNMVDTSEYFTITVVQKPEASADWGPNPPQPNVPVSFSNSSRFADTYLWFFGDGQTSTEFQPIHEYDASGSYEVRLVAMSKAGCSDTFLFEVNVIVNPLLDVPNAFTPGRFGVNSVINVRGFGIIKMDWRIYNRWGQLVFQSNNKREGWDGTFKGKLQPIDVYTYSLNVEFSDGKKLRKTGDITLLR